MKEALLKEEILFLDDKYKRDKIPKENRQFKIDRLVWNIENSKRETTKEKLIRLPL